MDGANVNGGNAEESREDSNLESGGDGGGVTAVLMEDSLSNKTTAADAQEVNGDLKSSSKKHDAPFPRRKMRKLKANSTSTVESDATEPLGTRGRKRKFSELEDSSEDSEFNGFDSKGLELQPGSHVLKKLIGSIRYYDSVLKWRRRDNYVCVCVCVLLFSFFENIFISFIFVQFFIFSRIYWKNSYIKFLLRFY